MTIYFEGISKYKLMLILRIHLRIMRNGRDYGKFIPLSFCTSIYRLYYYYPECFL